MCSLTNTVMYFCVTFSLWLVFLFLHFTVSLLNIVFFFPSAENTPAMYLQTGEVRSGVQGIDPQVTAGITTSFLVLIGIFFPSVTGKSPLMCIVQWCLLFFSVC